MLNEKFQIFVSSTYEDLKDERDQVIKAILEMGHIPVGMEMFSAGDEEQWRVIANQIDQTDYYVVILAHRYGSTTNHGVSYTEKEYDYAVRKNIPVIAFIIDDTAKWSNDLIEKSTDSIEALNQFKEKTKKKMVDFWKNKEELYGKVPIALHKAFTSHPRPGWIRATGIPGPEVIKELTRLSGENADLRKQLEDLSYKAEEDLSVKRNQTIRTLKINKIKISFFFNDSTDWERNLSETTLFKFFEEISPVLMNEASSDHINKFFAFIMNPLANERSIRTHAPIPTNYISEWLSDLVALDLIKTSDKKHSLKDTNDYWTLTEEGKEIYKMLRLENLKTGVDGHPEDLEPEPKPKSKTKKKT